jgi:hypothetical protein
MTGDRIAEILSADQIVEEGMRARVEEAVNSQIIREYSMLRSKPTLIFTVRFV